MNTQARIVLEHLQTGRAVTALISHVQLGVRDLTGAIRDLRAAGHEIAGEWYVDEHQRRYMTYWMENARATATGFSAV